MKGDKWEICRRIHHNDKGRRSILLRNCRLGLLKTKFNYYLNRVDFCTMNVIPNIREITRKQQCPGSLNFKVFCINMLIFGEGYGYATPETIYCITSTSVICPDVLLRLVT